MASFDTLIRQNKRNTIVLMVVFTVMLCALASVITLIVVGVGDDRRADARGPAVHYNQPPPLWHSVAIASAAALAVAAIMTLFANYGGAKTLMSLSGAREIDKQADPQLFNIVEELCIASNMPKPRIFVINDTAPNAFATGRDPKHAALAITTGLRQKLTRDELQGVMAHELSHIQNYDIRLSLFAAILVGMIVLLADFLLRYLWWGGGSRRRSRDSSGGGGGLQLVLMLLGLVLAILAPLFAHLLHMALSRQREYLADASAAEMTRYPEGLARALAKLESDTEVLEAANRATASLYIVNPFKPHESRFKHAGSTHPPIKERIKRLMTIGQV